MDKTIDVVTPIKKPRSSNLELFRIFSMFLIVLHHYIVNSNVIINALATPTQLNSILALSFGAWGKMGINCFVLITGYFMCKTNITLKKFMKLIFEIEFYRILLYVIFLATGYEAFSIVRIIKVLLPVTSVRDNFTGCFLLFYLCIPFLNYLTKTLNEKNHIRLLLLCLFIYTILGSVPKIDVSMNYVSWFIVLYVIASYVRLYPKKLFDSTKLWGILSLVFFVSSIGTVIVGALIAPRVGQVLSFYFLSDSNKVLAVALSVSLFMFFKNLKIKNSKLINNVAMTTFGIFLIHANSDAMRNWLWRDTLKNAEYFASKYFVLHALASVVVIFIICSLIDFIRIVFVEKYYMKLWDKIEPKIVNKFKKIEEKICKKFNIGERK